MSRLFHPSALRRAMGRAVRDESGATLVEFTVVLGLFLLLFFALIDFGRLYHHYVLAEKALQIAARTAAVRPAVVGATCTGTPLPPANFRPANPGLTPPRYGTSCGVSNACAEPENDWVCQGDSADATAHEIWSRISPIMPADATVADLYFRYRYDPDLNFLGGPYVPVLTVELNPDPASLPPELAAEFEEHEFVFVSPLSALAGLAAGSATASTSDEKEILPFPRISVSLPAEDLGLGHGG